jgi:stage II sporulation protein D
LNSSSLPAGESWFIDKSFHSKSPKTKKLIFTGALFLIVLSTACGKHKAQVNAPALHPAVKSVHEGKKAADQQASSITPKPVGTLPSTEAEVVEHPAPGTEGTTSSSEAVSEPMIRIGLLTSAKEVRISSSGDYFLLEKTPEASRQSLRGEIQVRLEQGGNKTTSVYQIQVASFARLENAEEMLRRLSGQFAQPVTIRENQATGTHQVRLGEFPERGDAQSFLRTLAESGLQDAFIVRDTVSAGGGKSKLALRGPDSLFRLSEAGFLFIPSSSTTFLCVNGKPYRGSLDVLINRGGRITVVNQVGIEEYLLGVVPAEISPSAYPEDEALAALSIAARTYALYHKGQFGSEGFDLTDDTRTQVYGGVDSEKAATDEAVRRTRGIAVYYQNKIIDAMYMSTCGGRTEDFSNVFDAPPVPYLKSVFCAIEGGPGKGEMIIEGTHELGKVVLADDGSVANRNLELARILGVFEADSDPSMDFFVGQADRDEAVRWVENAVKIARGSAAGDPPAARDIGTRGGFLRFATEAFFGNDEIRRKVSARDVDYYMANLQDGDTASEPVRYALAYLMKNGLWRPSADNTVRPDAPIRRCDALSLLLRWIESVRPEFLRKGIFVSAVSEGEADSAIRLKWGGRTQEFPLSKSPALFRLDGGRITPVSSLRIIGNEKIAFHVSPTGAIDFLEIELSPNGASSDRYSPAATWDVTFKRSSLAEKLRSLTGNIGELKDFRPARFGNSGRVIQVEVIGSRNSVTLNGYKVRNALGLKDTLYTITREHDADGSISNFTFYGRGMGHGVGLCQVGAFGMARAGRSYEEILKTYYQGVEIRKAY